MDLTDRASTLASTEQWVFLAALSSPAETALALRIFRTHILQSSRHIDEFLELLFVSVGENTVGRVALLFFSLAIDVHRLL